MNNCIQSMSYRQDCWFFEQLCDLFLDRILFSIDSPNWQIQRKSRSSGNCLKWIRSCINASVFKSTFAVASSINKILLFLRIARPFQSHQYFKKPTHCRKNAGASFLNKAVAFHQHSNFDPLHLKYSHVLVQLIPFLSGSVSEMTH